VSRGTTEAARSEVADSTTALATVQAEQDRRIRSLETELAAVRKSNEELRAARSAGVQEGAAASPRPLADLSIEELIAEIRRLGGARYATQAEFRVGFEKMVQACDALLEKPIDGPQKIEALTAKGIALLRIGEHDRSETVLREVVGLAGPLSKDGRNATFQLAMVSSGRKDNRRAAEILQGLARQPDVSSEEHARLRFLAATYLSADDKAAALVDLKEIVREFEASADKGVLHTVAETRKEIARLEKSGE
jgi:hypothetical protein